MSNELWLMTKQERKRYALWLTHSNNMVRLRAETEEAVRLMQVEYERSLVKVNASYVNEVKR